MDHLPFRQAALNGDRVHPATPQSREEIAAEAKAAVAAMQTKPPLVMGEDLFGDSSGSGSYEVHPISTREGVGHRQTDHLAAALAD